MARREAAVTPYVWLFADRAKTLAPAGGSWAITPGAGPTLSDISLTLRASGFQDLNYTGTFLGENSISGTLNGSGFNNVPLTVNRN